MIQQSGLPLRGPPAVEECIKYSGSKDLILTNAFDSEDN